MKSQKCIVCSKAKGKRGCLIKDKALVCSRCCAEIRYSECEGCSYYKDSKNYAVEKAKKSPGSFVARIDPAVDERIDQALMMVESGNMMGESIIRQLWNDNMDLHTVHYAMGTVYAMKDQFDEAMDCFDKALEIYPYFAECWFNRALAAQNKLDVFEMITSFQKALEMGGDNSEIVHQAGQALSDFERGVIEETGLGMEDYLLSLSKFDSAFELMENQQWDKACSGFQQVVAINRNSPQSFGNMALCFAHLAENEQALEAFDKAIELDPHYEPAIINKIIFQNTIEKGGAFSENFNKFKAIEYSKDYSVKDDKLLLNDYLEDWEKDL